MWPQQKKLQRVSTRVNWSLREKSKARERPNEQAKMRSYKQERQGNDSSLLNHPSAKSMCNLCTIVLSKDQA